MISASDARNMSTENNVDISKYLFEIDELIKKTASSGVMFCDYSSYGVTSSCESYKFSYYQPSIIQKKIMSELARLGYIAMLTKLGAAYVPRGLQDDDGAGPEYCNIGISISWSK